MPTAKNPCATPEILPPCIKHKCNAGILRACMENNPQAKLAKPTHYYEFAAKLTGICMGL